MKHDFNNYKFRASSAGKLMTEPKKGSKESISETTKTYLLECYIGLAYGRKKEIISKTLQKGLAQEEDSLTLLSRVEKTFFKKNDDQFSNDWLRGTPDIIHILPEGKKIIRDIKTSWDIFTFFNAKVSQINKDYWFQLQVYMDLTGAETAFLDYCLVNTPPALIESEKRKFLWNQGIVNPNDDVEMEAFAVIEKNCLFDDIPMTERIHTKVIDRNQDDINRLHDRIIQCREYMNETFN
jgi:hypothetical protein